MKVYIINGKDSDELAGNINVWIHNQTAERKLIIDVKYAIGEYKDEFYYSALIIYND